MADSEAKIKKRHGTHNKGRCNLKANTNDLEENVYRHHRCSRSRSPQLPLSPPFLACGPLTQTEYFFNGASWGPQLLVQLNSNSAVNSTAQRTVQLCNCCEHHRYREALAADGAGSASVRAGGNHIL